MMQHRDEILGTYRRGRKKKYIMIAGGFFLVLLLAIFFTTLGTTDTDIGAVTGSIWRTITAGGEAVDKQDKIIVLLRLPRMAMAIVAALATAAVISFTGVIGFVGLAGPHIARLLIGSDHRYLLPFSAVMGAFLMLVADTIGRLILAPVMIPVGIVISFLGVPIFINLILVQRKGEGV